MKMIACLSLLIAASVSATAHAQSREAVNPTEAHITTFLPGAPLQVLGAPILLDTRPNLITHPGGGSGGLDESRLQNTSQGMGTIGFGVQQGANNRIADEFVVPAAGWQISDISVYTYQTGSTTTSTITGLNFQIWDGDPSVVGSTVVFGDTATNRMSTTAFTNIFRVTETTIGGTTRPIMSATASGLSISLPAGTYWLDWQLNGSLASGPWAPPLTILGQPITGNGLQSIAGVWGAAVDGGTGMAAQGFPMTINGVVNEADVGLTKIANGAGALIIGSNFSYDITVSNAGPAGATGVVVTDALPAQVSYVSNTCGASFAAPTLTWTVGALANGASQMCTVNVTVVSGGSISNTASATSTSSDPTPANDSATAVVGGAPADADVSISKTVSGANNVDVGANVSYLLSVSNAGPADATGVVVTDSLPATLTYVSNSCGASYVAPTLTWTIGALANGASATCTLVATVGNSGQISNTANVSATNTDPNSANNSGTAVITGAVQVAVPANSVLALLALMMAVLSVGAYATRRS